jgi:Flp pilus assembly pilin Flp
MKDLFYNEQGQATTEYILVLAVAISLFMIVFNQLLKPFFTQIKTQLTQSFQNRLFSSGNLHHFPVSH